MATITSRYYREDSFTTHPGDSSIRIGDDYLDFSGYETVTTMRFYTDGGLTIATEDDDTGEDFSCGVQLKINGTWTSNISSTWLYIPPWGPDVLVEGYFDVSSKSADIIRYGIDGIRLKFGTYAEVKAWENYDYICEFTATKEVSLGVPSNVSVSQTDTHINVGWSHAYYNGSGTRTYYILGENSDLWGGKTTLGSGYTGTSASIAIQDSWRGKTITIYVGATATDWGGEENFGAGVNITLAILGIIRYCYKGQWKECIPHYVVDGVWKECIPYYGVDNQWKELI